MTEYKYKLGTNAGRKFSGEYRFICENVNNLRGEWGGRTWGHRVVLVKDGVEVAKCVARYYNRTWERYTYESAIRGALYNYKQKLIKEACDWERGNSGRLARGFKKNYAGALDVIFKDFEQAIKDNKLEEVF